MMADAFLSILPLLILYLFSQRAFLRGMTSGIGTQRKRGVRPLTAKG